MGVHDRVSPGFRLRPSLSARYGHPLRLRAGCVAGVQTPAFVERHRGRLSSKGGSAGVAGVQTPAFVERDWQDLAEIVRIECRRGSDSGLR